MQPLKISIIRRYQIDHIGGKRKLKDNMKKNGSGYSDPTAYKAICKSDKDQERFDKFLRTVFAMAELAGFHIEERLVVTDKRTGRIWR